jgi:membrane protease YdiL (CAAX protease family)/Flp pilus assembly protein TadD
VPFLVEPKVPDAAVPLPGPGFWGAIGYCLLVVIVQTLLLIPLRLAGLNPLKEKADLVPFAVAATAALFLTAWVLVRKNYGPQARRILAVRRMSGVHLVLVLLLAPPLLVVNLQAANWFAQGLGQDQGPEGMKDQGTTRATTLLATATPSSRLMDQIYEELAKQSWLLILIAGCLLPGLGEEMLFRGFLGRGLLARFGPALGILVTSALFGLLHLDPVRICATTILGVGLHLVYLATRSFWAPVLLHALNNVLAFALMQLALDSTIDLSGLEDGPNLAPLVVLAALAAVAALGLLLYQTRVRWVLPDGSAWSPGYVTAEMPFSELAAVPRRGVPRGLVRLAAVGAYLAFGGVFAYLGANPSDSSKAWSHARQGDAFLERDEYDSAIAEYSVALQLDPANAWVYSNRGFAFLRKRDFDRAMADFDQAIQLDPNLPEPHCYRGQAYSAAGKNNRAIADFNAAIRLNPQAAEAYFGRALCYQKQELFDWALPDYDEVIRLNPKEAAAYYNRGLLYAAKEEFGRAIADYSQAIALNPKDARAYWARSEAYQAEGDQERAQADRETALRLDPGPGEE